MLNSSQAVFVSAAPKARSVSQRICTRLFAASLAASALAWSNWAAALGLGEITLHSALNQPLNAEIQLLETGGLSAEDIVVRLASTEAFAKSGIERGFFLNDLRFTSEVRGNRGVVRVVSSKAVTEPYLNFLVQVARPNGDLFHEYTLLLDPATSPEGLAATRSRQQQNAGAAAAQSRMPVAPPPAVQGKRYTVARGDTLNGIAQRVSGRGSNMSASQMADGIRALNPQIFPDGSASGLKAGQGLLLPDAAVLPTAPATASTPSSEAAQLQAAEIQKAAEQLAASTLESQQLAKAVEELTTQAQNLQDEMAGKDKEITALRADLAQAQAPAPVAPVAAAPVAAPPVAQTQDEPFLSLPLLLGILALIVLLVAYAITKRRQQRQVGEAPEVAQEDLLIKPAQAPVVPVYEVPAVAPQPVATAAPAPVQAKAAASPRLAGAAPDALDGVSIYIAYGRFSEAMGILRNALETQPEREDIRIRILELLAEQGDVPGFEREEVLARDHGVEQHKIDEIRARYPQLKVSEPAAPVAPVVAPAPLPITPAQAEPVPEQDLQLDESTAATLSPVRPDEFQLNLDDLSMDADWDLVDPFDAPPARNQPPAAKPDPEVDPAFSSNLTELPEVFELSDEQFLSDFDEPELTVEKEDTLDPSASADGDALSDEFLDSFMGDDSEFDLLDLDEAPLTQINQAQMLIDEGDFDAARDILNRVIEESDEQHRQMAREMLAGIS